MPSSLDPVTLTPEERSRELARIIATGLLRLARPIIPAVPATFPLAEIPGKSRPNELAVSLRKSVTVHAG